MDVYIARQPIFDRYMNIYGYELLYRQSDLNCFTGIDDDAATNELIYNSLFVFGLNDLTDGKKAFVNFSKDLISSNVPYLLPKEHIVFEILERKETTQETIDACKKLRADGFELALDDFVMDSTSLPLMDMVSIIKVEYPSVSKSDQWKLIKKLKSKSSVKLLAEKIETREDYQHAVDMGYDYFQGYFFSKPSVINSNEIESLDTNLICVLQEINKQEPSYSAIADIIQRDLGMTYKLLKLANSAYMGAKNRIISISHALSFLGVKEIYKLISLMMLKRLQNVENAEMIKLSLIRGKLMELLAIELKFGNNISEYFFTGMFSFIDVLMNKPMEKILEDLPLSTGVKQALLGEQNLLGRLLKSVIECENGNWDETSANYPLNMVSPERFMELYIESLRWAKELEY